MTDLVFHELRIRLRSLIGWSLGLSFFGLLYLFSYPQLSDVLANLDVKQVPIYQAFGQSNFSTFESFLASSVINFLPVLLGIYAIIDGTKTLVGEEEMGTLELLVTLPLRRWQVTAAKALAMSVIAFTVLLISGLSMWAGLAIIRSQVESSVTGLSLLVATLNAWPITLVFMMMSLFLGALLPTRRTAAIVATLLFVVSYFGNNLAVMLDAPTAVRAASPFYYYDASETVLLHGPQTEDVLLLLGVAGMLWGLGMLCFQRRDLTVNTWPWRWPSFQQPR